MERPYVQMGQRIREARVASGQTQRSLADALGVTVQSVSQWENGRSKPEMDRMIKMADYLSVRWSWIKDGEGHKEKTTVYPSQARDELSKRYAPLVNQTSTYDSIMSRNLPEQINDDAIIARYGGIGYLFAMEIGDKYVPHTFGAGDVLIFDTGVKPRTGDTVIFDGAGPGMQLAQVRSISLGDGGEHIATLRPLGGESDISKDLSSPGQSVTIVMVEHRRFRQW